MTETNTFLQAGTYKNQTVGGLNLVYAYNNEGKLVSVSYPTDLNNNTPTFTYTYDSMMRLSSMTDGSNYAQPVVNGAQYNAANQLTALNYYDTAGTRSYNSLMQLTNITATSQYFPSTSINVSYSYPGGANNGKISSMTDAISGETVSYQYDSLNRLISASGSGWTQTQAYDGFGNLSGRTGTGSASGTTISTPANQSTNQLSGYSYDANGNLLSTGYGYDPENRLIFTNAGAVQYGYDAKNKRIWQGICSTSCTPSWTLSAETITIFGADGKQLASYTPNPGFNNTTNQVGMTFSQQGARIYFGGKLVQYAATGLTPAVITDRLGSVGKYYPYGEERNSPQLPNDQVKFATYTRDSATGNDYADQRYYSSALGRFMTRDRGGRAKLRWPQSWNRYSYVWSDPINYRDSRGLDIEYACDDDADSSDCNDPNTDGGGGGGGGGGDPGDPTCDDSGCDVDVQPNVPSVNNYTQGQMQDLY